MEEKINNTHGYLNTAYQSNNPTATLYGLISHLNINLNNVKWLVANVSQSKYESAEDLKLLKQWCDKKDTPSQQAILSHYIYFATSLVHLWGCLKNGDFYLNTCRPVICYCKPNTPSKYIWINAAPHSGELSLVKHNLYSDDFGDEKPFRAMVHRTWSPKRMDKLRFSFDLTSRRCMQTVRNTSGMLHISIRFDNDKKIKGSIVQAAQHWGDFYVLLSYGTDYRFLYMAYNQENTKKNPTVTPCTILKHLE